MKKRCPVLLLTILIGGLILNACPEETDNPDPNTEPLNVSAYLRTWSISGGNPYWYADMIRGEYLSDIILAFALINHKGRSGGDGYSLYMSDSGFTTIWDEVAALKTKYPHIKVSISVGGYGAEGFSDMAHDPVLRAAFVANVCEWLKNYDLDGVDIDWEYPVGPSWNIGITVRPADKQNYISLLGDLRSAMDQLGAETGKYYSLSTAVPASSWFITANDVRAAADIVDGLKLMSYDYYGDWSNTTGHNANLYRHPRDNQAWSTDQAVKAYLNAQVPPEKIILGLAFYGQMWRGVSEGSYPSTPGLFRPYTSGSGSSLGWNSIKSYLNNASYTRYWDDTAKAPFLYNGNVWISYTDHEQIRALTAYAKEQKLGGLFVWEYGHDTNAELLQTLAQSAR